MFDQKPDYEKVMRRYDAWWDGEIVDRALTRILYNRPAAECIPYPSSRHASLRDRWMDTGHAVANAVATAHNYVFGGDALPIVYPNLGPEVFSAFYGCPLEFGETTSWSRPVLEDWSPAAIARLQLDLRHPYFLKILELSDAICDAARGKFIVGYTDLHPGGDAIAAFRDPQQLCLDVLEHPDAVAALCDRITDDFLRVYEIFYARLSAAGMPSTTWLGATCRGRYHVPSNDFSCMVSAAMFDRLFLPAIVRECEHMDRSFYHLDGPGALRFLDTLLAVPKIHAIQWVAGAGHDYWGDWIDVFRKIRAARKSFVVYLPVQDLQRFMDLFGPEGVWLCVGGVTDAQTEDNVLRAIERWTGPGRR